MKFKLSKLKEFVKRKKKLVIISSIILILLVLIGGKIISAKNQKPNFEYFTVSKADIVQEVSVTGKVSPATSIDYAFETSGKVAKINVKVGDQIQSGKVLATLKNNDTVAQVSQASAGIDSARSMLSQYQAQLDMQKARLAELQNGPRPEDLAVSQAQVDAAQKSVADAETNLVNVQTKAASDFTQVLQDCANTASSAINYALNSLNTITNIQYAHFMTNDQDGLNIAQAKGDAINALVGASGYDTGRMLFVYINSQYGGARASVQAASDNPTEENVQRALNDIGMALSKISLTINTIPFNNSILTAAESASLSSERTNNASQISLISAKSQSIAMQKNINQNLITGAQNQINQAQNNLNNTSQQMNLKKSGASAESIQAQQAAVKQAEANVSSGMAQVRSAQASLAAVSAQYNKSVLTSTITGIVTKVNIKEGEMAPLSQPVISVMTNSKFQVEADVPEADIAKIKVDNTAQITLDAYGSDASFDAKVVKIDPAETVIEGVSTYKITLEFTKDDERVKSGMTANTTISTAKKENTLIIPQRYVIKKDGKNFVLISEDGKTTKETEVEIGLIGSDGNVEVLSGLKEGDKIVNPNSVSKK